MNHSLWHAFKVVFSKELRELLRDRKTLFWLFAPPIILPAIALIAAAFIGTQTARYVSDGFQIAVVNAAAAPELMAVLHNSKALIVHEYPDATSVDKENLITLTLPSDFQQQIDTGKVVSVKLVQRDNSVGATLALGAVRSEISTYNGLTLDQRLKQLNLDQHWLTPVTIEEDQIAAAATSVTTTESGSNSATGGLSGLFLPLAVTSWLVGGGLGLIVDTTVGEKERQTIESILVTPASRVGIVLGKLAVVFIASLLVMGLWMVEGMVLSLLGSVGPQIISAMQGGGTAEVSAILAQSGRDVGTLALLLLVLLLPFIVVLNSLVMAFCSFASSYRESNTFLFLLQLMLPALVLLSVFSIGPDAGVGWYAAPLLGTIIAVRDLFGNSLTSSALVLAVLSASAYAGIAILVASYVYSHEWALARR
jgi:sodium transport system permease protein